MGNERDQVISYLLQACDQKNLQIQQLTKQLTEAQQQVALLQEKLQPKVDEPPKEPIN